VTNRFFTQRRKDRKGAKARSNHLTAFASLRSLRLCVKTYSVSAAQDIEFKFDIVVDAHHPVKC